MREFDFRTWYVLTLHSVCSDKTNDIRTWCPENILFTKDSRIPVSPFFFRKIVWISFPLSRRFHLQYGNRVHSKHPLRNPGKILKWHTNGVDTLNLVKLVVDFCKHRSRFHFVSKQKIFNDIVIKFYISRLLLLDCRDFKIYLIITQSINIVN